MRTLSLWFRPTPEPGRLVSIELENARRRQVDPRRTRQSVAPFSRTSSVYSVSCRPSRNRLQPAEPLPWCASRGAGPRLAPL